MGISFRNFNHAAKSKSGPTSALIPLFIESSEGFKTRCRMKQTTPQHPCRHCGDSTVDAVKYCMRRCIPAQHIASFFHCLFHLTTEPNIRKRIDSRAPGENTGCCTGLVLKQSTRIMGGAHRSSSGWSTMVTSRWLDRSTGNWQCSTGNLNYGHDGPYGYRNLLLPSNDDGK